MSSEQDSLAQNPTPENTQPAAGQQPAEPRTPTAMPEDDDPDMVELRAAEKAIADALNADANAQGDPQTKPADNQQAQPAAQPDPKAAPAGNAAQQQPQQGGQQPIMIPKARLDEVLRERDQFAGQANYFKGIAEARGEMVKQNGTPANPQTQAAPTKTVDEVLNDISDAKIKLAEQYEAGEITAVQWKQKEVGLERIATNLQTQLAAANLDQVRQQASTDAKKAVQDDQLHRQADDLESRHPYAKILRDDQLSVLGKIAGDSLRAQGVDPNANLFRFRAKLAELTDQYGPMMTGKTIPAQPVQQNTQGSPQPAKTPGSTLSDAAQARQVKSNLAAQQPPNTNLLGSSGGTKPEITEADIMKMTDDEISVLPVSVQQKFVGAASR